jgi:hypothetical protein
MLRKSFAATLVLLLGLGAVLAEEVEAIFKSYSDGKITATVTVKEKNKETNKLEEVEKDKTFPVYSKAKVKLGKKNPDQIATDFLKSVKGGMAMKLMVDEGTVTEIVIERKKK